jgi:hypothetical protein
MTVGQRQADPVGCRNRAPSTAAYAEFATGCGVGFIEGRQMLDAAEGESGRNATTTSANTGTAAQS